MKLRTMEIKSSCTLRTSLLGVFTGSSSYTFWSIKGDNIEIVMIVTQGPIQKVNTGWNGEPSRAFHKTGSKSLMDYVMKIQDAVHTSLVIGNCVYQE